jgi:hypothetical protein
MATVALAILLAGSHMVIAALAILLAGSDGDSGSSDTGRQ